MPDEGRKLDLEGLAPLRGRWLRYGVGGIIAAMGVPFLASTMTTNPPSSVDPLLWEHLLGLAIVILGLWIAIDVGAPGR
jgi:hypothetical protein